MLATKLTHCTRHCLSAGERSPMPALMLPSLPSRSNGEWEIGECSFWREEYFYAKHSPMYMWTSSGSLKGILKRPSAWVGTKNEVASLLHYHGLFFVVQAPAKACFSDWQMRPWQITGNMSQVSKTNHNVVILHDLHGINLWTIGES